MTIYCVRTGNQQGTYQALADLLKLDPAAIVEPGNPVTFWVTTALDLAAIRALPTVEDAIVSCRRY